jgi:hypothetical protein
VDNASWERLLREALAVLSLSAAEQIRVNGPGCIACDLLNDFDHAREVATGNAPLSEGQVRILHAMDAVIRSMKESDIECFDHNILHRPVWTQLRQLAADALREFGWEGTVFKPFIEREPGVWQRPLTNAEQDNANQIEKKKEQDQN